MIFRLALNLGLLLPILFFPACASKKLAVRAPLIEHPIVSHCTILDPNGQLIWSYPAYLCVFLPDGRFLSADPEGITFHDRDQKPLWFLNIQAHHMITIAENGDFLVLASHWSEVAKHKPRFRSYVQVDYPGPRLFRVDTSIPESVQHRNFRADRIVRINQMGHIVGDKILDKDPTFRTSLLHLHNSLDKKYLTEPFEDGHLNSIYEIPPNSSPILAFKTGNILINDTTNKAFLVLDPNLQTIVWQSSYLRLHHGAVIHDVQLLANGNLLMFLNWVNDDHESKLIEVDPVQRTIVWQYAAKSPGEFYTPTKGSVQPLGDHVLYAYSYDDDKKVVANLIDRNGNRLWHLDLSPHFSRGIQGAYQWPVEEFLKHASTSHEATTKELDMVKTDSRQSLIAQRLDAQDETAARETIESRVASLKRFLNRQVDPYRGPSSEDSACNTIFDEKKSQFRETSREFEVTLSLLASPSHAIDCYGNSPDRLRNDREYLYCKSSGSLYEINLYSPLHTNVPDTIAHCR